MVHLLCFYTLHWSPWQTCQPSDSYVKGTFEWCHWRSNIAKFLHAASWIFYSYCTMWGRKKGRCCITVPLVVLIFSVFLMSACQFLALFFFFLLQNIRWNLLGINLPKIQDVIFAVRQRPLPACFTWWTAILVVVSVNRLARTDCRSVSSAIWLHFWLQVSTRRRCVCSGRPCWLAPVCRRQC